ncbi:hypothetical protein A5906_01860 [Bradyrhizobium sacchari]|uniref:Alkanesulfonate monooxygenase SsuD/methylene tetrahydromethanopterin reductase-like flavin-dependent oxidoreductase (Luciferase family) n=1 Tax=Bradyrhizobium sacchari TaxID=1399419 RepID=A0A560JE01_9BRAD|nr:LLM class flavin-dependent oxidoreductase [Bradyrhizobium sacchari]OPY96645.1 hypothetical protein A5906_01860 [Bradyrhizobium sacchari]TWB51199.1 alkanesulfonate monooxygenase SsuD/methylene tetrahydromethanopterin reductase-like flavin-dependent oxidoreductase (luciferase family) [Bradyrhizobium sacchari]TWB69433.1 alkanesulfonate monooxygenase SsuD/methylene tetrahydromethanopterin reductase-like flavin-dependent oxidoreductase (luciferase family) [Bradyrhizobium sacchari]
MAISYLTDMRNINGAPITPKHYDEQIQVARHADELGYKTVWIPEDHCMDDGFCPAPLTTLAAFARETKRIRLGTGIAQVPTNHPRRILEEACVVDVLSHGRLTLGLGIGAYETEYKAFGVPWNQRGKLMEEGVKFIKQGFAGGPLPDGLPLVVPPVQRPIPIIGGTKSQAATDRSARLMDGNLATWHLDHEKDLGRFWNEWLFPSLQKHGRKLEDFQLPMMSTIWASETYKDDWHEFLGPAFLYRSRKYDEGYASNKRPEQAQKWSEADRAGLESMLPRMLVDTPKNIVERLTRLRKVFPFDELVVMKVQGIPHELFVKQLTTLREQIAPLVFPENKW